MPYGIHYWDRDKKYKEIPLLDKYGYLCVDNDKRFNDKDSYCWDIEPGIDGLIIKHRNGRYWQCGDYNVQVGDRRDEFNVLVINGDKYQASSNENWDLQEISYEITPDNTLVNGGEVTVLSGTYTNESTLSVSYEMKFLNQAFA